MDAMLCPDDTYVGRNPNSNCEFYQCPNPLSGAQNQSVCTMEVKMCPDGTEVGRDSARNCQFTLCPDGTQL